MKSATRMFALAAAALPALFASSGVAQADDTGSISLQNYRVLQGREATRFLIGNSLMDPPYSDFGRATYFVDDGTAMVGAKSGRSCVIDPWKFTETDDCGSQSLSVAAGAKCMPFHVLALRVTKPKPKAGTSIGYYMIGKDPDEKWEARFLKESGQAILAGNATSCPLAKPPASVEALELPDTNRTVALETAVPAQDETVSPGALIEKILVGNSIVWPRADDEECGMTDYFGRDGRIYVLRCGRTPHLPRRSNRPVFDVGALRWRMVGARFCIENVEAEGSFDNCNPIRLTAFPFQTISDGRVAKHVHAAFVRGAAGEIAPPDNKPGLVVKGNPARFILN